MGLTFGIFHRKNKIYIVAKILFSAFILISNARILRMILQKLKTVDFISFKVCDKPAGPIILYPFTASAYSLGFPTEITS